MVRVLSDSTCDLSKELTERYQIGIIPLHIVLGEQEFRDGLEISPDQIYAWSDENKTTPKTSAVSFEDSINAMKPILDAGDDIVVFCISESMSTTGNVLRMAAEELEAEDRVHVINSENLSTGIGLLVIQAAIMAKEGKTAEEIVKVIQNLIPRVRASFVVDTLVYLHRGGRCSGVAAIAGTVLRLHPTIKVENGAMIVGKKYRGKQEKVLQDYAKEMEEGLLHAKKDRVFITHSGRVDGAVEAIRTYLEGLHYFDEILITNAGGVVSSHCGPGTLGVLYIAEES